VPHKHTRALSRAKIKELKGPPKKKNQHTHERYQICGKRNERNKKEILAQGHSEALAKIARLSQSPIEHGARTQRQKWARLIATTLTGWNGEQFQCESGVLREIYYTHTASW
jgi:hypothetical protein